MGYHTKHIEKGTLGEFSKIREEYEELTDAVNQGSKVMEICQMCDLIGAIKSYAFTQYNLTLDDLIQFLEKTESAFKDGTRR